MAKQLQILGIAAVAVVIIPIVWLCRNAGDFFSWSPTGWEHDEQGQKEPERPDDTRSHI
jgi:hypothetical protein